MFELPSECDGILPIQWLKQAAAAGVIYSQQCPIPDANFQPASLDLRLGDRAYRLRCSFLPGDRPVQEKLDEYTLHEFSLEDGAVLESNRPYLIPLIEGLRLPPSLRARANPKSSTGRLDVFTRLITDFSHCFDEVRPGYRGNLYLEVVPRSFTIKVRSGLSLNQVRLIQGTSQCGDQELQEAQRDAPIVLSPEGDYEFAGLLSNDELFLRVDLMGDGLGIIGYRTKKNSELVDLSRIASYEAADFWEPIYGDELTRLVLEPEEFYILLSYEKIRVPPQLAGEMIALDPTSGEFRTHYAGFFDPGFGYGSAGEGAGTRAVMEVRAHDVPFMIENRQRVCKLKFERMLEAPDVLYGVDIGSSYYDQGLRLSKHFLPITFPIRPGFSRFTS
jgi:dCTP deaminase